MPLDPDLTEFSTASPFLINFDFQDFAERTGLVKFNLATARDDSANLDNIVTRSAIFSDSIVTETVGSASGTATRSKTHTFSLSPFNLPVILKGTATANIGWGCEGNNNSQGGTNAFLIVKIHKNSSSLGEAKTSTVAGPQAAGAFTGKLSALNIVVPRTVYNKDDVLKVVVEEWTLKTGSSQGSVQLGHDPQNRDGNLIKPSVNDIITSSNVNIPFDIE